MGNEKSKQKKFDVQSKEQFDKLDLNQDGVLTQDEIRKNILEYKSSEGSKETDLDKMVAATEKKKKEELESQVKDNIGKAVKDLRTKLQITTPPNDQNEKIVALQKTFEAAIQAQVKKAGVAKRGALTKEADRRVKVIYEKADSDQNGKIDFAEYKTLLVDKEKLEFFKRCLDCQQYPLDKSVS